MDLGILEMDAQDERDCAFEAFWEQHCYPLYKDMGPAQYNFTKEVARGTWAKAVSWCCVEVMTVLKEESTKAEAKQEGASDAD